MCCCKIVYNQRKNKNLIYDFILQFITFLLYKSKNYYSVSGIKKGINKLNERISLITLSYSENP